MYTNYRRNHRVCSPTATVVPKRRRQRRQRPPIPASHAGGQYATYAQSCMRTLETHKRKKEQEEEERKKNGNCVSVFINIFFSLLVPTARPKDVSYARRVPTKHATAAAAQLHRRRARATLVFQSVSPRRSPVECEDNVLVVSGCYPRDIYTPLGRYSRVRFLCFDFFFFFCFPISFFSRLQLIIVVFLK